MSDAQTKKARIFFLPPEVGPPQHHHKMGGVSDLLIEIEQDMREIHAEQPRPTWKEAVARLQSIDHEGADGDTFKLDGAEGREWIESVLEESIGEPWDAEWEESDDEEDDEEDADKDRVLSFIRTNRKRTHKIEDASEFWLLFDQMTAAKCGFVHNRDQLLAAYTQGHLYTVQIEHTKDTDEDIELGPAINKVLHCHPATLTLPAFCTAEDGDCSMIWVREDLRRLGIASQLLTDLKISKTSTKQLEGSQDFWRHHGLLQQRPRLADASA